jgi:HSP20 family protein
MPRRIGTVLTQVNRPQRRNRIVALPCAGAHELSERQMPARSNSLEENFMNNLTRFNPFKSLSRLDPVADANDFFRSFGLRPSWPNLDAMPDIRLDVSEDDKAYRVKAEIPGVDKNDIDLSIDGNQIAITAEIKRESKKKEGEREICSERYYGKIYRAFSTPTDVDSAKAEAKYDKGVLSLTLPKKPNGQSRKVAIS